MAQWWELEDLHLAFNLRRLVLSTESKKALLYCEKYLEVFEFCAPWRIACYWLHNLFKLHLDFIVWKVLLFPIGINSASVLHCKIKLKLIRRHSVKSTVFSMGKSQSLNWWVVNIVFLIFRIFFLNYSLYYFA